MRSSLWGNTFVHRTAQIFVALAFVVGTLGFAGTALAQDPNPNPNIPTNNPYYRPNPQQSTLPATVARPPEQFGCNIFKGSVSTLSLSIDWPGTQRCFVSLVYNFIAYPISLLLGIVAKLFNYAFSMSIGASAAGGGADPNIFKGAFVQNAWVAVRDLINITFIFALLQVAILLIVGKAGGYQDRLKNIIIAAVFINFSFFIVTELILLFNNLALAIFNQVAVGGSLADGFTAATGIMKFNSVHASMVNAVSTNPIGLVFYLLFSSVLMVIFIVVLLFSIALFVTRYIALLLCVVFSPVLFLGYIWPGAMAKTKELETTLKGQLLFPIIYLLMIWLSINFISITGSSADITSISYESLADFAESMQALVFRFAVAVALMISSLVVAKKYSTLGSSYISKAQQYTGAAIGKTVFAPAAYTGRVAGGIAGGTLRNVGGRLASVGMSANSGILARGAGTLLRPLGRTSMVLGDKASTASFDIRGAKVYQQVGGAASMAGIYGKAQEGGFDKMSEAYVKKLEARRAQFKKITASESIELDGARKQQEAEIKRAKEEFETTNGVSVSKQEETIEQLKDEANIQTQILKQLKSTASTAKAEFEEARRAKQRELNDQKQALLASGTPRNDPAIKTINDHLAKLTSNKNIQSSDFAGNPDFAAVASTLKTVEDTGKLVSDQQKMFNEASGKLSGAIRTLGEYEKKKKTAEKTYEKTAKAINEGGKLRAEAYDRTLAGTKNNPVFFASRQELFARTRAESLTGGKGGGKKK